MIEISPLISLPAFFISFIIVLLAIRLGAELIVYLSERKARKTLQRQTGGNVPKAVQRYYNTYRKGA